jgi:hypothetical protein
VQQERLPSSGRFPFQQSIINISFHGKYYVPGKGDCQAFGRKMWGLSHYSDEKCDNPHKIVRNNAFSDEWKPEF